MTDPRIADFRRWCYAIAHSLLATTPWSALDVDDIAQEGLIALWRALDTFDESKGAWASYGTRAAMLRMRDVALSGKPLTGEGNGKPGPNQRRQRTESLDALAERVDHAESVPAELIVNPDDDALITHHAIIAALLTLPVADREVAHRRYWQHEPLTGSERAAWSSRIRPSLTLALTA